MKRIIVVLCTATVAILLAGCATVSGSGSAGTNPVDLTKPAVISTLCGSDAAEVQATIAKAAVANPDSGLRNSLKDWGIADPTNDKSIVAVQATLSKRVLVTSCRVKPKTPGSKGATVALTDAQLKSIVLAMTEGKDKGNRFCTPKSSNGIDYVGPVVESRLSVTSARVLPDSPGTPFKSDDPATARGELFTSICHDALMRGMWLTFEATTLRDFLLKATDGRVDLLTLNPRLKSFTDISKVKAYATDIDPLEFMTKAEISALSPNKYRASIAHNSQGLADAELVDFIISRFKVSAPEARPSIVHYTLTDYAFNQTQFGTIGIGKTDTLLALLFTLVEKNQCGELVAFGANVTDKSAELFTPKGCNPAPPSTTPPSTKPPVIPPTKPPVKPPCVSCYAQKTNHVPSAGNDPSTKDDGTGQIPLAPTHTDAPTAPVQVNTSGSGPVDTGTTLTNVSGTGSTTTPAPPNNGTVTEK